MERRRIRPGSPARVDRPGSRRAPFLVVTDVDGCLLDARTFRAGASRHALAALRRAGVPVLLATSKTRREVRDLSRRLGARFPAAVEGGGGIWIPAGTLRAPAGARALPGGALLPLAAPHAAVRRAFAEWRSRTRSRAVGFGDLTAAQIARRTGLPVARARLAAAREFDEPFSLEGPGSGGRLRSLARFAARRGLRVTRGGRFHHLHGAIDKGKATRLLLGLAGRAGSGPTLVALGDSPHDLPLLRLADVAVLVPRPDGRVDPWLRRRLPRARRAPAPGPRGWAAAVLRILAERS